MADDGGLAKWQARMAAIPKAVKIAVRPAMEKSAQEIVDLAKSLCPVGEGTLRDSIGWTWGDAPEGSMVLAQGSSGELTITIYAGNDEAFYARWIEFGTKAGAPPHGFFFTSYRLLKNRATRRINRATGKAVRDNWGG
ncbi:HK97 gp10 family phage protein [Agrobacterium rhizogenes]|nr:HK97 gp10 family phage protein [Rhizobium rhizogenes]NTH70516.1 HK97 gp10 family phage protein [Rhizobium rhizogenes]NTJ00284.1 HK97 gp10 family phage protein [Rhizobium rhizogenes]